MCDATQTNNNIMNNKISKSIYFFYGAGGGTYTREEHRKRSENFYAKGYCIAHVRRATHKTHNHVVAHNKPHTWERYTVRMRMRCATRTPPTLTQPSFQSSPHKPYLNREEVQAIQPGISKMHFTSSENPLYQKGENAGRGLIIIQRNRQCTFPSTWKKSHLLLSLPHPLDPPTPFPGSACKNMIFTGLP